jgi:hypothetical protein
MYFVSNLLQYRSEGTDKWRWLTKTNKTNPTTDMKQRSAKQLPLWKAAFWVFNHTTVCSTVYVTGSREPKQKKKNIFHPTLLYKCMNWVLFSQQRTAKPSFYVQSTAGGHLFIDVKSVNLSCIVVFRRLSWQPNKTNRHSGVDLRITSPASWHLIHRYCMSHNLCTSCQEHATAHWKSETK